MYCWFLGDYTIPEKLAGQTLFIFPKIKGYEGMLWVDKKPYGNFTSKVIQNSYGYHYCDLLRQRASSWKSRWNIIRIIMYAAHSRLRKVTRFSRSLTIMWISV